MTVVLAISSQVARGHVGLSAIVPALQRLGHEVIALPTVLLSNHPGHEKVAGERVAPELLMRMMNALGENRWLSEINAVLTGYLPTVAHVEFAADVVALLRQQRPDLPFLCDPVLGDDPEGLYIDASVAESIRDRLLPLASVATPNRFELQWLSGMTVASPSDAIEAARALPVPLVVATSIPNGSDEIANVSVLPDHALAARAKRLAEVPHGTGDLFSAFYLARYLETPEEALRLGFAIAGVNAAIVASLGMSELELVASQASWSNARDVPVKPIS